MENNKEQNILAETFGEQKCWVNWKLITKKDGSKTKIPFDINNQPASSTDSTTWSTYEEVAKISQQIGIVFTQEQTLLGIDIDHCIVDGRIEHAKKEMIADLILEADTYTEKSPSLSGLHLLLSITEPLSLIANKKEPFEIYTSGRYFTATNQPYGEARNVRIVTPEQALEILKIIGYPWGKDTLEKTKTKIITNISTLDDVSLLEKMFSAKNGDKVKALYNGDISEYNNDDSSADLALCSHLAFWTGCNAEQIERLWISSPLGAREKTQDRKDYRDRTINTAIQGCTETFGAQNIYLETFSIEEIEVMLKQIPIDTPKVKLMEVLNPIFQNLIHVEKITAENFILYNIKEFFDITKEDAKKYITHLNGLRKQSTKINKEEKRRKERLPLITDRDIDSQEAHDAILEIGIVNEKIFKIITAIVISAKLRLNPPLWLFLIGVPSSFKTEFVGLFEALDEVYTLDTLSENAFSSGYVPPDGSEPQDLLPYLDNKAFIIKDLNTLFSMNEEMVKKILGDLTSIFDGKFEKFTATRGLVEYNSLFSMIGCITPSILIKHYNYATQLGPRFMFLRVPELTQEEMERSLQKFWDEADRKNKIIKTRQIVSSFSAQLISKIKKYESQPETEEMKTKINNIAQFMCKARGIAISNKASFIDDKKNTIEYFEIKDHQIEQPWRILNQLKALLRILSFINGNEIVGEKEIEIIRPVILSTMPVERAEVLEILAVKCGLTCKELSKEIGKSSKTIQRTMKELEAVGITDCFKDPTYNVSGKAPWMYFIRGDFASVLNAPMPSQECLSQSKSNIGEQEEIEDEED